jgi:hypothetical protein
MLRMFWHFARNDTCGAATVARRRSFDLVYRQFDLFFGDYLPISIKKQTTRTFTVSATQMDLHYFSPRSLCAVAANNIHSTKALSIMKTSGFYTCSCCSRTRATRKAFVADFELRMVGYDSNIHILTDGLITFRHRSSNCENTFVMRVGEFMDLPKRKRTGSTRPSNDLPQCTPQPQVRRVA